MYDLYLSLLLLQRLSSQSLLHLQMLPIQLVEVLRLLTQSDMLQTHLIFYSIMLLQQMLSQLLVGLGIQSFKVLLSQLVQLQSQILLEFVHNRSYRLQDIDCRHIQTSIILRLYQSTVQHRYQHYCTKMKL